VKGTTLRDGRYAITGLLGEGSQGQTLEALDKRDGRLVAIKRFQVKGARSWKDVELAEREARVLSRLSHPLLPAAIEHFEEDGALYLVMDRIEGETVAELGHVPEHDVVAFLYDAAEVLDYLHGRAPPLIHRDIKPGNVIRRAGSKTHDQDDGRPRYVLVDFGSVRDTMKPKGGSTVVGTFGYMAPEQLQGRALPATDVYAAGATALHMLTGIEPEDLPHKGLGIDVRKAVGKHVDRHLVAALEAMLVPDPDERASAIGPLLAKLPRRAAPPDQTHQKPLDKKERKREGKRDKADRKRQRRRQRRDRKRDRSAGRGPSLPWFIIAVVGIAMAIARFAVALVMLVVVPALLSGFSVLFGSQLRQWARAVTKAGHRADDAMVWAQERVLGAPQEARKVRIDAGQRVGTDVVDEAVEDIEAAVEAAVEEAQDELERVRRG
jgi:serine/threonine protein kinase